MNNKIKFLARVVSPLLITHIVGVSAETYAVKPGDSLSKIAKRASEKSGYQLSPEQILLTLHKLNQDAFISGDINKLIIGKELNIPDNNDEYIQLPRYEAKQRLREKNLADIESLASNAADGYTPSSGNQDYAQILKRLNDHQQNIELLKIENAHISRSFKLLERALGRVVLVQGLMTNDLLKVKSKISDKTINNSDGSLGIESVKPLADSNILAENSAPAQAPVENSNTPAELPEANNTVNESTPPVVNTSVPAQPNESATSGVSTAEVAKDDWLNWAMAGSILLPLIVALMWALDFRQIRSRRLAAQEEASEAVMAKASAKEKLASSFDSVRQNSAVKNIKSETDDVESSKLSLDTLATEHGEPIEADSELVSALELLDMCLLFGDYKQAKTVALKAVDDYQDSPILAKKIAFIDRKLAKV